LPSCEASWGSASSDTFSSRRAGLSPSALALGRRQPLVAQGPRSGPAALPAVKKPQGWKASLALHFSSDAGSFRVANRTIRFGLGPTPSAVSENTLAAPSKPRRGGKAARLEGEPCATFLQRRGFLPRRKQDNPS
jgi:hypothetical protein